MFIWLGLIGIASTLNGGPAGAGKGEGEREKQREKSERERDSNREVK